MSLRRIFVTIHSYVGLVIAGFIIIAGLTGTVLAWYDSLDDIMSSDFQHIETSVSVDVPLDPLLLRDLILKQYPHLNITYLPLYVNPEQSYKVFVEEKQNLVADQSTISEYNQLFVNPYTGDVTGGRRWGDITQGMKNLMPFIYRLHSSLALGDLGVVTFGVVALLWTIDCFSGLYLTFPAGKRKVKKHRYLTKKNWLQRWKSSWKIRWKVGDYKLNFDLHRAGGLWLWVMLFIFAWSSVSFNLTPVYELAMHKLFQHQVDLRSLPVQNKAQAIPAINWVAARVTGQQLMSQLAKRKNVVIGTEQALYYDADRAIYGYVVNSSRDLVQQGGNTRIVFDANSGELKGAWLPTGEASGDTIYTWLLNLHTASLWGIPYRIFISVLGLLVGVLSITGVIIWWRKRSARKRAVLKGQKISVDTQNHLTDTG